ncbi:hypothetical protein [Streptomyces sp. NPDC059979]
MEEPNWRVLTTASQVSNFASPGIDRAAGLEMQKRLAEDPAE